MSSSSEPVFSEAHKDFDPESLSPEARRTLEAAQRAASAEFAPDRDVQTLLNPDGIKAAYKIELQFGPKRTPQGPNAVCIQIFESGKRFHGGGDDKMYWCRDVTPESQLGCGSPIPSGCITGGVAQCPNCMKSIRSDMLTGEQFHFLTTQNLALKVEQIFLSLRGNADIYCKYHPMDIRYQAVLREKGFEKARQLKGMFIYPLKNILKDTSAGASLSGRFRAFLGA